MEDLQQFLDIELSSCSRTLKGEDTWVTQTAVVGEETLHIAAVFDGHGGKRAAYLCRDRLIGYLLEAANGDPSGASLSAAGATAFRRAHDEVRALDGGKATDGSTATVVLINPTRREITSLNAGDSSAKIVKEDRRLRRPSLSGAAGAALNGSSDSHLSTLTTDHRIANSESERQRLVDMGALLAHARDRCVPDPTPPHLHSHPLLCPLCASPRP